MVYPHEGTKDETEIPEKREAGKPAAHKLLNSRLIDVRIESANIDINYGLNLEIYGWSFLIMLME